MFFNRVIGGKENLKKYNRNTHTIELHAYKQIDQQ